MSERFVREIFRSSPSDTTLYLVLLAEHHRQAPMEASGEMYAKRVAGVHMDSQRRASRAVSSTFMTRLDKLTTAVYPHEAIAQERDRCAVVQISRNIHDTCASIRCVATISRSAQYPFMLLCCLMAVCTVRGVSLESACFQKFIIGCSLRVFFRQRLRYLS